jgi:hypothetical protein
MACDRSLPDFCHLAPFPPVDVLTSTLDAFQFLLLIINQITALSVMIPHNLIIAKPKCRDRSAQANQAPGLRVIHCFSMQRGRFDEMLFIDCFNSEVDRWNKSPFSGWLSIHDFSGIPIKCHYVNFQEFLSILKSILMQVRRENSKKLHTFPLSTGLQALQDRNIDQKSKGPPGTAENVVSL